MIVPNSSCPICRKHPLAYTREGVACSGGFDCNYFRYGKPNEFDDPGSTISELLQRHAEPIVPSWPNVSVEQIGPTRWRMTTMKDGMVWALQFSAAIAIGPEADEALQKLREEIEGK